MKRFLTKLYLLFLLCLMCIGQDLVAQGFGQHKNKFIRKLQKTTWTLGLSGTVIDDDAKAYKDLFDVKNNWNFLYYPSKMNIEGYIDYGLSVECVLTYSLLKKGKLIGTSILRPNDVNLVAFDINSKFYFKEVLGSSRTFSPYIITGLGYTYRSLKERKVAITGNIGFGFYIWIYRGFGLNAQSLAKFALNNASSRNYLQHSAGISYRFNLLTGYKIPEHSKRYNLFNNE